MVQAAGRGDRRATSSRTSGHTSRRATEERPAAVPAALQLRDGPCPHLRRLGGRSSRRGPAHHGKDVRRKLKMRIIFVNMTVRIYLIEMDDWVYAFISLQNSTGVNDHAERFRRALG